MTRVTLLLFITLSCSILFGQTYEWSFSIDGFDGTAIKKILPTADNHVIVMGNYRTNSSIDIDPSSNEYMLEAEGGKDVFVAKYTKTGDLVWGFRIAGGFNEFGHGLHIDQQQNICIAGEFEAEITFFDTDTTQFHHFSSAYNGSKGYVARYTSDGNFIDAFFVEGENGNVASGGIVRSVTTDPLNNIYITGELYGDNAAIVTSNDTLAFNTSGRSDLFVASINPDGTFNWGFIVGGTSTYYYDAGYDIQYNNGGLLLGGVVSAFYQEVDFNPLAGVETTIETHASESAFLARYDLLGTYEWVRCLTGDDGSGKLWDFDIDDEGNIFSTGSFSGSTDFDPSSQTDSITSFGCDDIFVTRYSATGDYVWGFHAGSEGCDNVGYGIDVVDTNLYLTGTHSTQNIPSDFDPSPADSSKTKSSTGYTDIFVARYNTDMEYYWAMSIGMADYEPYAEDDGFAILGDTDGIIYTGGSFIGKADFDVSQDTVQMGILNDTKAYFAVYDAFTLVPPVEDTTGNGGNGNAQIIDLQLINFSIFPNPAESHVFIPHSAAYNPEIYLTDLTGKQVEIVWQHIGELVSVDLQNCQSGVYFVELYDTGRLVQRSKLIVQ